MPDVSHRRSLKPTAAQDGGTSAGAKLNTPMRYSYATMSKAMIFRAEPGLTSIFEERAEHLSAEELRAWTAEADRDRGLLRKLTGPGAKLLSGPRGSGKSTLLRRAYFDLTDDSHALAVYVNFSKSLALEPLFHKQANALQIFRQWVIYKLVIGVSEAIQDRQRLKLLSRLATVGRRFVHDLETGSTNVAPDPLLAPSELLLLLEDWTSEAGRNRCVLLLDDAAHAFSPEQQREFFEIFRALRSRLVSAKAAVYPGITSYSPFFHVGHEAEILQAWYEPDSDEYLQIMRSVAQKRLPAELYGRFEKREEILDYLAIASFGIPRGFLNMLSFVLGVEEDANARPTRRKAEQAVELHAESVRNIFRALKGKLPRYKRFIDLGIELQSAAIGLLRNYNRAKEPGPHKTPVIAILEPLGPELERILAMAEYAGLARKLTPVSRGVKGTFQRYSFHYSVVISENALALGKSYQLTSVTKSLSRTDAHAFVRTKGTSLLGDGFENRCILDLAPCPNCGTPRSSQDARFCVKCGAELKDVSLYEELVQSPIDHLPLTPNKIKGLKEHTNISTVQDILLDEEATEIRRVPYVGPVWASRIKNAAQEFVSV